MHALACGRARCTSTAIAVCSMADTRLRAGSDVPPLASEDAVIAVVRHALGRQLRARVTEWHVRRDNYVVAAVDCESPSMQLIVKLEVPGERPNRRLDVMASIAQMVRAQTSVPTFDVVAVDVTRLDWPWEYLVVTELRGVTW